MRIGGRRWLVDREYTVFVDPGLGPIIHILSVRLKHKTLTWTKAAYIDQRPVSFWKLIGKILRVRLVRDVNIGLCAT
jgi:hypothetical protein